MDIESAYRIVPVQPGDRPLLGMRWKGEVFFDTRLPFGLQSAPKIFSSLEDALQWLFRYGECPGWHITWVILSVGMGHCIERLANLSEGVAPNPVGGGGLGERVERW